MNKHIRWVVFTGLLLVGSIAPRSDAADGPDGKQQIFSSLTPTDAVRRMVLPPGFKATLFAGEPDIRQPIAMAIDDWGRLWVAEAYAYPQRRPEGQGQDRILIFADADGDGHFDKRTVFIEGLNLVSGLEVGFGGVWVGAAPYLYFIPDKDADDKPDGPPQILLDGWGYQDTHETLNSFIWGPDGWLYGCHGVYTHSHVGRPATPAGQRVPLNAAIWRYHPTRHLFEVFAHGTSNPWGVDFNDWGHAFSTACVIPHLFHVIQGARYERQAGEHFNPHTYDDIKTIADHRHFAGERSRVVGTLRGVNEAEDSFGGGHAHAGAMVYLGGAWPEKYRNQIFMNNIHGQRINMDLLARRGSGYVGRHGPDFILTRDESSQILNLRYGPDGQVFMIDWYDRFACHSGKPQDIDRENGRIFKISFGAAQPLKVDLRGLTDVELAERMLHPNDWHVRHASRNLQERAAARAILPEARVLLEQIAFAHNDVTRRLRGLWALHVIGALDEARLLRALADPSPEMRGWGVQMACETAGAALPEAITAALARGDTSPLVRLYLASALQRMPLESRWSLLAGLTRHAEDARDHNLPLMYWYAAEPLAANNPRRALALGLVGGETIPTFRSFMIKRLGSQGDAEASALLLSGLAEAKARDVQLAYLGGLRAALRGRRRVAPPAAWKDVSAQLTRNADFDVRLQLDAVAVAFGDQAAAARLRTLVADRQIPPAARRTALTALLEVQDSGLVPVLHQLVADPALRTDALRGLSVYEDSRSAGVILASYADWSLEDRRDALATLCSRRGFARALFAAIADKKIAPRDLTADHVRQLHALRDADLEKSIVRVWGAVRDLPADKAEQITKVRALLVGDGPADSWLGRAVFSRTCQQCHTLYGLGGKVGPDLTGSNRADREYLLTNIVDPSALIPKEYQSHVIATTSGRVITGMILSETDRVVTLQSASEMIVVAKDEIEERVASNKSMMPDELLKPLADHDVRALFAYLATRQQVPILATPENSRGLFNGRDLGGWHGATDLWRVEDGQLVGRSPGMNHHSYLVSEMAVEDFDLTLEVQLVGNRGNSGIQFRSELLPNGQVKGYQADVGPGWWGKLYEMEARATIWDKSGEQHVHAGGWNHYRIRAEGSHIRTWINGKLCVDLDDPQGARRGIIGLQVHAGEPMEVRYRNFQLYFTR